MSEPSGGFPDLRIVPVADLLLHERVDLERVTRLIDRLSADGILKNPPIVASLPGSERFLLLDGANRVSAIQNLDIPHLIVQVEPFENPKLEVRHWNHVVRDIEARELLKKAREIEGVSVREQGDAAEGFLAGIVTGDGESIYLHHSGSLRARVEHLHALVDVYYRGEARMDRVNHADVGALRQHHPHFGALVTFPDFAKADVRAVAEGGHLLPSGVTRILVPRRVLGFNLRLPLLKSNLPLEEKRRWLAEEMRHKVTEHKVRYYQEPTFVFDD
ncbi:MAG TPA: hypothetical protein VJ921_09095 [Vicinamibacteria bacterium]|nr:hypothetical protein [Vicinamibacteria bacterium]